MQGVKNKTMNALKIKNREINSGRYAFDGGLERLCVCGHSLGVHAAARVKDKENGKTYQDCFVDTFSIESVKDSPSKFDQEVYRHLLTGKKCVCICFKPAKKKK